MVGGFGRANLSVVGEIEVHLRLGVRDVEVKHYCFKKKDYKCQTAIKNKYHRGETAEMSHWRVREGVGVGVGFGAFEMV